MLPSLSLEQTANQRWRRIVFSRYIALASLAVGAALIPALSEHRWYLVAYVVLVGFPYNRLVQRLVAEQGSPGRWVVITDVVLVVMTVPIDTATTLPVCLVVVAVVALGTITVGRREPAIATIVGTVLLSDHQPHDRPPVGLAGAGGAGDHVHDDHHQRRRGDRVRA